MKKITLLLQLILLGCLSAQAQDVFDYKEPVTWLGLDCSALKLVKTDEMVTESELQNKYFPGWNDLILNEPKKFDLVKATDHNEVTNYVDAVTAVNQNAGGGFITNDKSAYEHLDIAKIKQMVKKYNLKGKTGLGLVFIMEGMDKGRESASIWVTYINMGTKEVLLSKQVSGKSGGFGFRNYWAGAINKVLKALPGYMSQWKKGK